MLSLSIIGCRLKAFAGTLRTAKAPAEIPRGSKLLGLVKVEVQPKATPSRTATPAGSTTLIHA
jgi:hypothetical protein